MINLPAHLALFPYEPVSRPRRNLNAVLLDSGAIAESDLHRAECIAARATARFEDVLLTHRFVTPSDLLRAQSKVHGAQSVPFSELIPDPRILSQFGATKAIRHNLLPLKVQGAATLVATPYPSAYAANKSDLERVLGPTRMVLASAAQLRHVLRRYAAQHLVDQAETRVREDQSCRTWRTARVKTLWLIGAALLLFGFSMAPGFTVQVLLGFAILTLALSMSLKLAAVIASTKSGQRLTDPVPYSRPVVSVLVPLFRETEIAGTLVARLKRLRYPKALLDVCLVVEEEDHTTHETLARTHLPGWMRVISVPQGSVQTKPRALNFALVFCRGSIVGIYDAEDAPEPDQIDKVVARFEACDPDVACLQGMLDFYNPQQNWMARAFTIEYATWFRVVLPGLERLKLVLPLGGTTLFFRRSALEALGGWDAHNVTEDADLGLRLARAGYRTEMLNTVTFEEANCRPWAWVRQRSRWLKGYAMTYGVHMRDPRALLRDLGPWKFFGVQVLFGATLAQFLLAPILWLFWLKILGVASPYDFALPKNAIGWIALSFFAIEVLNQSVSFIGVDRTQHRRLRRWIPTTYLYFPLGTLSVYKGVWELITRPFFWDKTSHGKSLNESATQPPGRSLHRI